MVNTLTQNTNKKQDQVIVIQHILNHLCIIWGGGGWT